MASIPERALRKARVLYDAHGPASSVLGISKLRAASSLKQHTREISAGFAGRNRPHVKLDVDRNLPALAWRGTLQAGQLSFTVGPQVAVRGDGFFEGVWAGDFADLHSARDGYCFGSGAIFDADGVLILVPKCGYEQVYILRDPAGVVHIANSLAHCLAAARVRQGGKFFEALSRDLHAAANAQTRRGAIGGSVLLVAADGYALHAAYHDNFRVFADGAMEFEQPYLGRRFVDFGDYRQFLSSTVGALIDNATDGRRERPLSPAVTVSRGYDSPAVAVLAAENGCREAVCMDVTVAGVDDSGAEIAEQLGLHVNLGHHVLGDRIGSLDVEYADKLRSRSLEFVATAGLGDDIAYAAFEPWLPGAALLTGAWGDSIWARRPTVYPGVPVRVIYGKSLTEYRLRLGFAHVPVPVIGGFFPRAVARISASSEMQAYSVGGEYDRPIPRRIVEQAGIARDAFGLAKSATNPNVLNRSAIWPEAMAAIMRRYEETTP